MNSFEKLLKMFLLLKKEVEKNNTPRSACDMFVPCYSEETCMLFLSANKILSNKAF